MAYKIYKSDGQEVIIQDGVSSEPFSIDFVGRNTVNYGETIASTQLHLLENFAANTEPANATTGQLWFDKTLGVLKVNASPNIVPIWNRLVTAEANNDLGTVNEPFNIVWANGFMGKTAGSPTTPFEKIYANDFYGGNFTGNFFGNVTSATTASTLLNTRLINVTGGAATGQVNLELNATIPAPYTVNLPLSINKLTTARTISLSGDATGSALFDGSANITIPTTVSGSTHTHDVLMVANSPANNLNVSKPLATYINPVRAMNVFFTTSNGMTGTGSSYSDLLVLNTAADAVGGMVNALEFDKQTKTIRHWQAAQGAADWGTPRTLAYTDHAAGSLTPGFTITLTGGASGQSALFNGAGNVNIPVTSANDNTKVPLAGGTMTGNLVMNAPVIWTTPVSGGQNIGISHDSNDKLNFGKFSAANAWQGTLMTLDKVGTLLSIGNVGAFSDARLKTNVEIIPDALNKVCSLRGVTYDRIDTKQRQTGVIAQEVREVLPEAVMEGDDDNKTLSVAYGNMAGLFIEAFKEMRAEIDTLKAELKKFQN